MPAQFTQDRPPFNYTHLVETTPISQHPIGAKLPVLNGKLQIFDEAGHLRILVDAESTKKTLDDWISHDVGQLGLHIRTFSDATLVSITWLHTLLDAMGRHALLRAWQAVLEGRDNDVPVFAGYTDNPLADLGKSTLTNEEPVLQAHRISKLGMARFVFNFLTEKFWFPVEEGRLIVLPAPAFAKIKIQAFKDLESLDAQKLTYTTTDPKKPFLSDGDILTAWLHRIIARATPHVANSSPTRIISVGNVMGMRDMVRNTSPALLPPAKEASYIHNCTTASWSLFSIGDFLSLPLGHVAAQIRADLVQQSTRAQIEATQKSAAAMGMVLYGSGNMVMHTMTNWAKAKLFETDFGAARVGGQKGSVKPTSIHPFPTAKTLMIRGGANCVGRDGDGNWWFGAVVRKEFVENLVREVEALAEEL